MKCNIFRIIIAAVMVGFIAVSPVFGYGPDTTAHEVNRGHLPKMVYRAIKLSQSKMSEMGASSYEWDWTGAVMMAGLFEMYELTGDGSYLDFIRLWLDYHIEHGYTVSQSDQVVPGLLLMKMYRATGDERYLEHAKRVGRYVMEEAVRMSDGGLIHFGPLGSKSMWIDSLFMLCPFLVELAQVTGDQSYLDEAVRQTLIMYGHLQDRSGLCRHYYDEEKDKSNDAYWLRGNSWALVATSIVIDALPDDYDPEKRRKLIDHFTRHARGLASRQDENGMWHTVIDDSKSYIESSGTALVTAGFIRGVNAGVLGPEYMAHARRGLWGLMDYVEIHPDGFCTIRDVSLGTDPGTAGYYKQVVRAENVPYGVGAYAMAVNAYGIHENYKPDPLSMRIEDGWEALRWGRDDLALEAMNDARAMNSESAGANFGLAFVVIGKTVVRVYKSVTEMSVGARGMTPSKLRRKMIDDFAPSFGRAAELLEAAERDGDFTQVTERIVFIGGTTFGYIQWDKAEVRMLRGMASFAEGIFYYFGSYNIDAPPLEIARREFGKIVNDPAYPGFLTLEDESAELLPKARAAFDAGFASFGGIVEVLEEREQNYPGRMLTMDLLRLRGELYVPGLLERQPVAALVSKNKIVQWVIKFLGRNVPDKLPGWMAKARESLMEGKTVPLTDEVSLNLSAPFENPRDLREFFSKPGPDGTRVYPDPTLGGLLPGMTQKKMAKLAGLLGKK